MGKFLIILLLLFSAGCSQTVYYQYKIPRTWKMSAPSRSEFMIRENRQFWDASYENFGKKKLRNYPIN